MLNLKMLLLIIGILFLFTGCTSIITAPLNVTGNVISHPIKS